jgi:hypothetical protein
MNIRRNETFFRTEVLEKKKYVFQAKYVFSVNCAVRTFTLDAVLDI